MRPQAEVDAVAERDMLASLGAHDVEPCRIVKARASRLAVMGRDWGPGILDQAAEPVRSSILTPAPTHSFSLRTTMRTPTSLAVAAAAALSLAACSKPAGTLEAATDALGAANLKSIQYTGAGRWFQFGQAPNPTLPWPPFDVSSFTADINYDTASARVQMARKQVVEPGRLRPAPVEQRPDQYVSGAFAWNGLLAFWVPASVFGTWFIVTFIVMRKVVEDQPDDEGVVAA